MDSKGKIYFLERETDKSWVIVIKKKCDKITKSKEQKKVGESGREDGITYPEDILKDQRQNCKWF